MSNVGFGGIGFHDGLHGTWGGAGNGAGWESAGLAVLPWADWLFAGLLGACAPRPLSVVDFTATPLTWVFWAGAAGLWTKRSCDDFLKNRICSQFLRCFYWRRFRWYSRTLQMDQGSLLFFSFQIFRRQVDHIWQTSRERHFVDSRSTRNGSHSRSSRPARHRHSWLNRWRADGASCHCWDFLAIRIGHCQSWTWLSQRVRRVRRRSSGRSALLRALDRRDVDVRVLQ